MLVKDTKALTVTGDATFKTSEPKVATVDEKGVVTAVAAGKATITVTSKKDETKTASVAINVTRTKLESVTQKNFNTIVATVQGDTASILTKEVTIKNSTDRVIAVKALAVDAKDKTQVTITAFEDMKDGKEYKLTIDGITVPFTVTDGKVAAVGIDKVAIPCDKDVEIKVVAKDANGVVVYEKAFAEVDAASYSADITSKAVGFTKIGSKIRLVKAGDTATAKIVWKSGKYDATGKAEGNIESGDITITATEPTVVDNFAMKIKSGVTAPATEKFDKITANNSVKITETTGAYAFFQFKDVDGTEVVRYADYTLESTNNAVITLVGALGANKYVQVVPGSVGTAYILVKKNNAVVTSFEVNVVAKSDINSLVLDKTTATLSNGGTLNETAVVKATVKDQYGADMTPTGDITVTLLGVSDTGATPAATVIADVKANTANKYYTAAGKQVTFKAAGLNKGIYQYKLSYKDGAGVEWAQTFTLTIAEPAGATTVNDTVAIDVSAASSDLVVAKNNDADKTVTIGVALYRNGVKDHVLKVDKSDKIQYVNDINSVTVAAIEYTIKNSKGEKILTYNTSTGAVTATAGKELAGVEVVTSAGIMTITTRTGSAAANAEITKLANGTYTVEATISTEINGVAKTPVVPTAVTFAITDSQAEGTVSLKNESVKFASGDKLKDVVAKALQYSGYDYNIGPDTAAGQVAFIATGAAMNTGNVRINYIEGTSNISGSTAITKANYNGGESVVAGTTTVTVNKISLQVVVPETSGKSVEIVIDLTKGGTQTGINFKVVS